MPKPKDFFSAKAFAVYSVIALLSFNYGNYWSAHWFSKWAMLLLIFSIWLSILVGKRVSVFLSPLVLFLGVSSVHTFAWAFNNYRKLFNRDTYHALLSNAAYSYACFLIAILVLLNLHRSHVSAVKLAMRLVFFASSFTVFFFIQRDGYYRGSFSGNASMHGCLIAATLPFVLEQYRGKASQILLVALASLCVWLMDASIPIGVLLVVLGALSVKSKALLLSGAGLFGLGALTSPAFFNSSGRFGVWKFLFSYWQANVDPWLGSGVGTGQLLFPMIQAPHYGTRGQFDAYLWLHSDWLQMLFEVGVLGFISAIIAYLFFVVRALHKPYVLSSLLGFGAMACFNYPLRLPIHAACFVLVAWLAIKERKGVSHAL